MHPEAPHVHWICKSIGVLQSGFDIFDLNNLLVQGISHDVMLHIDVTRMPAAEPVIEYLDGFFIIFVKGDFAIHGIHH